MATTEQLQEMHEHIARAYGDAPEPVGKMAVWSGERLHRIGEVAQMPELSTEDRAARYAAIDRDIEASKSVAERKGEMLWLLQSGGSWITLLDEKLSRLIDSGQTLPD